MMRSPPLEIHLLGPVLIKFDDQLIKISRRLERVILYYLAVEQRPVSRTSLIDMLWPAAENMDPRGTLRTALSRLRKELPESDLLLTDLDQVWLNLDLCTIDLLRFERSYQSLHGVLSVYREQGTLSVQIVQQIKDALSLWHGDTIIDGDNLSYYVEIENWRQTLDQKLRHQRKFLMQRLAKHYRAAGQLELALDLFTQLGRIDVLDVSTHLSIMNILAKLGRYQGVFDYCDALEEVYERDFHAPLSDEILNRCHEIQCQIESGDKPGGREWPVRLTRQLQLIGRETELSELKKAYFRGGLVLLQGHMGTGKTRLVRELFQKLVPKPTLFLAPARQVTITLPLSPIIHGLRRHVPNKIWQELDGVWGRQLSRLLPELVEIRQDFKPDTVLKNPFGQQHLFDALQHVFQRVAAQYGRLLFVLDDAQWADRQTLAALSYLVFHGFFDEQGTLIIISRPEDSKRDLDELIDKFYRSQPIKRITLNGLSPEELRSLAQQVLPVPPPISFADRLYQETKGNPFIALEIIQNILERPGELESLLHSASRLPLPTSVHALIRSRLNRLDERARNILLTAAVIGNSFSLETLKSVVDRNSRVDVDTLSSLVDTGYIFPNQEEHVHRLYYYFVHEKVHEVVLREGSPLQLQKINRRLAHHLVKQAQALPKSAAIANYYLAGGDVVNAFHWFLKSAEHAWSLGAKDEVLRAYQQAESLWKKAPSEYFTTEDAFQLYKNWSDYAYQSNRVEMLEETGIKLEVLGTQESDSFLLGVSQLNLAKACLLRNDHDTGLGLIDNAISNLQGAEKLNLYLQALFYKGTFHWWKLNYDDALSVSNTMLEICKTVDHDAPDLVSMAFNANRMATMVSYAQGDAQIALEKAQKTHKKYHQKLDTFDRIRSLNMLSYAHFLSANYEDCARIAQKALVRTKLMENSFVREILLVTISKTEVLQGHLDDTYRFASEALNLGEKHNHLYPMIAANCVLGDIFCLLHNYTTAMKYYRVAQLREGLGGPSFFGLENNIHMAWLLVWMGHHSESYKLIKAALDVTERTGMMPLFVQALMVSGLCELINGNLVTAEYRFSRAEDIAKEKGLQYELAWCKLNQVRLAMSKSEFDLSESILTDVLESGLTGNLAFLTLNAFKLCAQLENARNKRTIFPTYQETFTTLLNKLEEHTRSTPLKADFQNAKRYWLEGHQYP
jgi:DNA-binding SARP family transcriptional activator